MTRGHRGHALPGLGGFAPGLAWAASVVFFEPAVAAHSNKVELQRNLTFALAHEVDVGLVVVEVEGPEVTARRELGLEDLVRRGHGGGRSATAAVVKPWHSHAAQPSDWRRVPLT